MIGPRSISSSVISTGSLSLDLALGRGGLPRGRIVEIFGGESTGKSTLALHILAEAQQSGLRSLYIDMENCFDPVYARSCGVHPRNIYFSQPRSGEEAVEITHRLLASGKIDLIIIDTVAALVPRRELSRGLSEPASGEINQLLSPALRRIHKDCLETKGTLICFNQIRTRLKSGYGPAETSPGGMTLKLQAAVRIQLRRMEYLQEKGQIRGTRIKALIKKNLPGLSLHSTFFNIVYNKGIIKEEEIISLALVNQIISRISSQYCYREHKLGKDKRDIREYLLKNPDLTSKLEKEIKRIYLP